MKQEKFIYAALTLVCRTITYVKYTPICTNRSISLNLNYFKFYKPKGD